MINVSELIGDPDFTQPNGVNIVRRTCEIVNHRPSVTNTPMNLVGIITIAQPNTTTMYQEADRNEEKIHVFTYDKLFTTGREDDAAVDGYLSDLVLWKGVSYRVIECLDNAQYGYCRSTAINREQGVM